MTQPRITKSDRFAQIRALIEETIEHEGDVRNDTSELEAMVAFIDHEVELLTRKASAKSGPTKAQVANETVKSDILSLLEANDTSMRATALAEGMGISVQKTTALLRQMVMDGAVDRVQTGKVTTFKVAE